MRLASKGGGHFKVCWRDPTTGQSSIGWFEVRLAICLSGLSIALFCGCQQGVYRATSLPPELAARPVVDVQSLDLSRLSRSTFRSDLIYHGDVLEVKATTGAEENAATSSEVRVSFDGTAGIPLVGPVKVAGLSEQSAENVIRDASIHRHVYRDPLISVTVKERRMNKVTVQGAVSEPGVRELPAANSNLAAALIAAGGLAENASGIVEIRNSSRPIGPGREQGQVAGAFPARPVDYQGRIDDGRAMRTMQIDLLSAAANGTGDYYLDDGSFVFVKRRPERVIHVIGLTGNKQIILPPDRDLRLLDALAQAGGPRYSIWIANRVKVIRRAPGSDETAMINLSISRAKRDGRENILLAAGDVVSVEENAITFTLSTVQGLLGVGMTAASGAAFVP